METSLNRVWGIKRKRIQTALRGGVDRWQQIQQCQIYDNTIDIKE